jgi:hypothetical protein
MTWQLKPAADKSIYDPEGTSHAFEQLEDYAMILGWNFEEQIDGAPPDLLDDWRYRLGVVEEYVARIKWQFAAAGGPAGDTSAAESPSDHDPPRPGDNDSPS